ncbi:MAG: hypothetical protein WCB68_06865 [Pyrinomonadaceae bacterium]
MSANEPGRVAGQRPIDQKRTTWDIPGCIKYILLLFLLALLAGEIAAGEFREFPRLYWLYWFILLIKLALIIGLIILIWIQRQLFCDITSPIGCAIKEYDATLHKWIIRVQGTASGAAFGSYVLNITRGGMPYPMPVIYPGGGSSGTVPVVGGDLGILDVTGIDPDAFRVTLTVNPSGWGSARTCWQEFEILLKTVSITSIGGVTAQVIGPHPDHPSEALKEVKLLPDPPPASPPVINPEASIGEGVSVWGTADYDGCGRQMSEYVLQYKELPSTHPHTWRQDDAGPWTDINLALPFGDATHPRTYDSIWGTIKNVVQTPNFLTRQWVNEPVLQGFDASFNPIYDPKWVTESLAWSTGTEGSAASLNGRFTVRVRVRHQPLIPPSDPTPPELYDAATVWIDNRRIEGRITGMGVTGGVGFGECDELSLSQFISPSPFGSPPPAGPFTKVNADIKGRAWDPVILDSYVEPLPAPHTIEPNDNFGSYTLQFKRDGNVAFLPITTSGTRVPNVLQEAPLTALIEPLPPSPPDTGVLHSWNIVKALDAGPRLAGSPAVAPDHKIYRGERCAYLIVLEVVDTTHVGDAGNPHYIRHDWPFCIMNDIPDSVVPDVVNVPWPT